MLPLDLFIPIAPAVKGNSRKVMKLGGRLTVQQSDKAREAERTLVAALAMHPSRPFVPLDQPLRVDIEIRVAVPAGFSEKRRAEALRGERFPDRRPDRGNYLKLGEDALERAGFVVDDARVVQGDVSKVYAEVPGWRFLIAPARSPGGAP